MQKQFVWNGPMGVFEFDKFAKGTLDVAGFVADCAGTTVVGERRLCCCRKQVQSGRQN